MSNSEEIVNVTDYDHPMFEDPGGTVKAVSDETLIKAIARHGGAREGAGRPGLPNDENKRKPRTLFISDAELCKVKAFLASLRAEE